jgi:hypothetical protein
MKTLWLVIIYLIRISNFKVFQVYGLSFEAIILTIILAILLALAINEYDKQVIKKAENE